MKTLLRSLLAATVLCLLAPSGAHANSITVTFAASGFANLVDATAPPDDPVSGSFIYEAASPSAPIDSLTSISLSIAGHSYSLADIGFVSDLGIGYVGGLIDGVTGSGNFENDFLIVWDMVGLVPLQFLYAVEGSSGIWYTFAFPRFTVTDSSVPEPDTFLLFALGFLGLVAVPKSACDAARGI